MFIKCDIIFPGMGEPPMSGGVPGFILNTQKVLAFSGQEQVSEQGEYLYEVDFDGSKDLPSQFKIVVDSKNNEYIQSLIGLI